MFIITTLLILFQFNKVFADNIQLPGAHAPISVMGDHTHKKKEVMFSYRFMKMQMNKLYNNNKKLIQGKNLISISVFASARLSNVISNGKTTSFS